MNTWDLTFVIFCFTIAILSAFISWEFYKSKNGRLRILIIWLFVAKVFVYGGAAVLILANGYTYPSWLKVALNTPMFLVMIELYGYIRMKDK